MRRRRGAGGLRPPSAPRPKAVAAIMTTMPLSSPRRRMIAGREQQRDDLHELRRGEDRADPLVGKARAA